ncbi:uncharacterized protein LOC116291141 [Actinia tenebrosa]|uniref:Uncharacterized protein LOC116291141 n=1 Tax=Actinia tenebrosa TaxID=6105 RepID=A0A6P8HCF7_ACTTE|nr:uncharacterized protein LOC116291141 [Actinia tenebrosa]
MAFFLRKVGGTRFVKEAHSESTLSSDTKEKPSIDGVWGSNGRVFIATNEGRQLEVTDSVPRPRWTERYCTITESEGCPSSPVVTVLPNPSNPNQIYIIHSNSVTECFENNPQNSQWAKRHSFQLSNAKGARILSAVIHPNTSMFFWCEKRAPTLSLSSCCLCMREVPENWSTDVPSTLGAIVVILHSCPLVSLFIINKGICLVPHLPDEDNRLLFYWTFVPRALKAWIWNHNAVLDLDKTDFKSIIMKLLPIWHSFPSLESNYILGLTTHPTTLELLLLEDTFSLSSVVIKEGKPLIERLCILSIPDTQKSKQVVRELFALGLFVGLVWESGACDIFDCKSGTPLCTLTDLTGIKLNVWTCAGTVPGIGVWSSGGVWEVKSSYILEVAEVIQTAVKPIELDSLYAFENENHMDIKDIKECDKQADVDNDTTTCSACQYNREFSRKLLPNCRCLHHNVTMSGPVSAMAFLHEWGMFSIEAKIALSSIISKMLLDSSDSHIEQELLEKVVNGTFQSPVFALTSLFNHPLYKDLIIKEVENFMEKFQCNEKADQKCIKTVLNASLFPYLQKFVALVKTFDEILRDPEALLPSIESNTSSIAAEAREILNKLNLGKPESEAVFRLYFLHSRCPKDVVQALNHYLGLQSLASQNASNVSWSQQWRKFYRLEWKDGQWQKSRSALDDPNNPFLSVLCNMLYSEEPDWLVNVRESGMAVVRTKDSDERAQEHVNHLFLDCLPALKVEANQMSTHVHSKLLWAAGQEMQAMQILLRHEMWSQALDFYVSLPKDTNSIVLLFTMMIKAFLRCGAPKEVSLKALGLVPHGFCSYEILAIMRENGPRCAEPFQSSTKILTIGDVRSYLQKFMG